MAQPAFNFIRHRRASFKFNALEWIVSGHVRMMTLAEQGALFTRICVAVDEQDFAFLAKHRRYVSGFRYPCEFSRQAIPQSVRQEVYERDGYACVECAASDTLSLDHIFPFSRGGEDTVSNLRVLCRSCNSKKGAKVI